MPVKKAVYPGESLPLITSETKYLVRYRIVSDDGALKSQWSSLYELEGNDIQSLFGGASNSLSATVSSDERYIFLQWEPVGVTVINSPEYDIFAQWSTDSVATWNVDDYEYIGTVSSNNFSVQIPSDLTTFGKFAVQLATQDKAITDSDVVPLGTIQRLGLGEVETDTIYDAPDTDGGEI